MAREAPDVFLTHRGEEVGSGARGSPSGTRAAPAPSAVVPPTVLPAPGPSFSLSSGGARPSAPAPRFAMRPPSSGFFVPAPNSTRNREAVRRHRVATARCSRPSSANTTLDRCMASLSTGQVAGRSRPDRDRHVAPPARTNRRLPAGEPHRRPGSVPSSPDLADQTRPPR